MVEGQGAAMVWMVSRLPGMCHVRIILRPISVCSRRLANCVPAVLSSPQFFAILLFRGLYPLPASRTPSPSLSSRRTNPYNCRDWRRPVSHSVHILAVANTHPFQRHTSRIHARTLRGWPSVSRRPRPPRLNMGKRAAFARYSIAPRINVFTELLLLLILLAASALYFLREI